MPPRGLDVARRRLMRLQRALFDLGDLVDRVVRQLGDADAVAGAPGGLSANWQRSLRDAARRGVAAVWLERESGCNVLHLEQAAIELPEALADLVEHLLADPGGDAGPLIGWTPSDVLRRELDKRRHRALKPGALRSQIYHLRERLRAAGQNPYLVQTSRTKGARFARRRSAIGGGSATDG
jgi:hypothetical protein